MERPVTHEPLLSQLARVSDTSQSRIEIQNVDLTCACETGVFAAFLLHNDPRTLAFALHLAKHVQSHFRQRFREDNAVLLEDTRRISSNHSVQRNWIAIGRKAGKNRPENAPPTGREFELSRMHFAVQSRASPASHDAPREIGGSQKAIGPLRAGRSCCGC